MLEGRSHKQLVTVDWEISSDVLEQLSYLSLVLDEENHALGLSASDPKLAIRDLSVELSEFQSSNH